ncbi:MAG: IclR family transcriptional regulator [Victivallales bacterium]|nr:IclR family transcriptional regulator [Victivallales bacterium]
MRVRQVKQALEIIRLLEERPIMRFGELLSATGISKPSLAAMLKIMTEEEYLSKRENGYVLGLRFLNISSTILNRIDLRQIAYKHLQELHSDIGERIELSIPDAYTIIFIEIIEKIDPIGLYIRVGSRNSHLNAIAPGKIRLAHLDKQQREIFYGSDECRTNTPNASTTPEQLEKECTEILKTHCAIDIEEGRLNTVRFAAAILNHEGKLVGIISVPVLSYQLTKERQKELVKRVKDTAEAISREIGFKGES